MNTEDNESNESIGGNNSVPNEKRIQRIDAKTAKSLSSSQVITSLSNVVKELLENGMDAKASVITIRLKEFGKELIEVSDNGFGINEQDFDSLAKRHCTSKLNAFEDLSTITSFGFRGEALNSLSNLADLSIETRHLSQSIGTLLKFDSDANVMTREPKARNVGTTVSVQNLFHKIPVRRKEFNTNIKREFDKMVRLVYGYCIGSVGLRITLTNQLTNKSKQTVLSSPGLSIRNNIIEVFDKNQLNCLIEIKQFVESDEQKFKITGFISKCDSGCGRSATDRQFFYVNRRPSDMKNVSKFINDIYHSFNRNQYPFVLLNIEVDKSCVDFNLSPDKRQLLMTNEEKLFAIIKESLIRLFNKESSCQLDSMTNYTTNISQKRRFESADEEVSSTLSSNSGLKITRCRSPCDSPFKATTSRDIIIITPPLSMPIERTIEYESEVERPKSFTSALTVLNESSVKRPQFEDSINMRSSANQTIIFDNFQQTSTSNANIPVIIRDIPMTGEIFSCGNTSKSLNNNIDITSDTNNEKKNNTKCMTECVLSIDSDQEENVTKDDNKEPNYETSDYVNDESYDQTIDITFDDIRQQFLKATDSKVLTNENKFSAKITASQNEMAEKELIHEFKKSSFSEMQIIGQFNRGFIVCKLGTDLFIVDQHASNERFNYERLLSTTPIEVQNLVLPMPLELSAANEMVVIDRLSAFKKLGFGIVVNEKAPSGHRLHLSSLPISKEWTAGREDIEEIVGILIETPIELLNDYKLNGFRKVIASRACRSSVMIGEPLQTSQMLTIVSQMSQLQNPWHCAHNRPTIRHLVNLSEISALANN